MTFKKDLKAGKIVEEEVCSIIKAKYPKAYVIDGYCPGYDIVVPEIDLKVEVKRDEKSHFTGNYVVETEFDGKPSGLTTTESEWWVFVDKEVFIFITIESLRYLVGDYKEVKFIGKGDTQEKKAYLIPVGIIRDSPYSKLFNRT